MDNKVVGGILIVAILIVGFIAFGGSGDATVSAQGISVIEVAPDEVSVHINIEEKADSAEDAKNSVASISDVVLVELIKAGLERDEIEFVNFNVYPNYIWDEDGREQDGFIARQDVTVKTDDFDSVSEIVDAAVDSGALISFINFELSEEKQSEFKAQALEAAGRDAKKKAEATAAGLDKKLGKLISVGSEDFSYFPTRYFGADAVEESAVASGDLAKEAAISISPGELEVRATVSVQYALKRF